MFTVGKKAYHVTSPLQCEQGTVIEIKTYDKNRLYGNWIKIQLKDGTTIADYETNFSKTFPSACKYFSGFAARVLK